MRSLSQARSLTALVTLWLTLSGCSALLSRPPQASIPERPAPQLELPPDAVPRVEPRSRYGNPASYEVFGKRYAIMADARGYREQGTASWYGPGFHGQRTSSGETYDMHGMTAAHKTLPLPVYLRVENLNNGRTIVVRVNDRGPFVGDRILDLSYSAAARLDMLRAGTAPVAISVLGYAQGQSAAAVTNSQPAPPAAEPVAMVGQFVQAGAFGSRDNAQLLTTRLRNAGFSNIDVQPAANAQGVAIYRVRIGPVSSAAEADDVIERLALTGVPDARLIHLSTAQ